MIRPIIITSNGTILYRCISNADKSIADQFVQLGAINTPEEYLDKCKPYYKIIK